MPSNQFIEAIQESINTEKGIILHTYPNFRLLQIIKEKMDAVCRNGGNVLILSDASDNNAQPNIDSDIFLENIYTTEPFRDGFGHRCSVRNAIGFLSTDLNDNWVRKLRFILVERGEDVFYQPNEWELFCYLLQHKLIHLNVTDFPQFFILIEPRHSPEPALKEALPIFDYANNETDSWKELTDRMDEDEIAKQWWTIWSSYESEDYRNIMYPNNQNKDIGILSPLAQFAGQWGIDKKNNLSVANRRSGEKDRLENLNQLGQDTLYRIRDNLSWQFIAGNHDFSGAISTYDNKGNPWITLKRISYSLPNIIISNVVVKQTMLLEYLIANAHCYATVPIQPLSPRIDRNSAYNTSLILLQRLQHLNSLPLSTIGYHLNKVHGVDSKDVFGGFKSLVSSYFGSCVADQLRISIEDIWDVDQKKYVYKSFVALNKKTLNSRIDWWLEPVKVVDGNNQFDTVVKDHVFQQFWKDKLVPFDGKIFRVDTIDTDNNRISICQDNETRLFDYRVQKSVCINQPKNTWESITTLKRKEKHSANKLLHESYELDFTVSSDGRIVRNNSMWKRESTISYNHTDLPIRNYKFGRASKISFLNHNNQSLLSDKAVMAFSAWLNEVAVTLLPEVHPFFVCVPQLSSVDNRPIDDVTNICIPNLKSENLSEDPLNGVWIFEDSQTDLGIIRTFFDNFFEVIDLCYDWLQWYLVDAHDNQNKLEKVCLENITYPSHEWFAYGGSRIDKAISFSELKKAIEDLFGKGRRYANTERRRLVERNLNDYKLISEDISQVFVCDICQKTIESNETSVTLTDGRISCQECTEVGLTDAKALKKLYTKVVKPFYKDKHNITDFSDLNIKLVNQREISQEQNVNFIPTSGFDKRAIGLAIHKGYADSATFVGEDSKHTVMIESGHSPESTTSTLVHELCHIWQFKNTNYSKLEKKYGKNLIEGHAVWSEESFLDYLEQNPNDSFVGDRIEKARQSVERHKESDSVYGKGYRLIVDKLGNKKYSAFDWILKHFPKK